jgi:hypothetical protein
VRAALVCLALVLTAASPAAAQLFSPGKLARPHAELEGLGNCTKCHELRQRGTSNALCLDCHRTLATRISAGTGLHAKYGTRNCAACHRDHLGLDHALVALDTTRFDHDTTGFSLGGTHLTLGCRDCHKPARIAAADVREFEGRHNSLGRTFLGLPVTCEGCHRTDSPHGTQFGRRTCDACHGEDRWSGAERFEHDRARFRLTGKHLTLECVACHTSTTRPPAKPRYKYTGIPSGSCTACHADPHRGAMTGGCTACHTTEGWHQVAGALDGKFDHSRTHYPLTGAHQAVACATCHDARARKPTGIRIAWAPGSEQASFGRPTYATCLACHLDRHEGIFATPAGGADCARCHGGDAWLPTTYDLSRHNAAGARYPLTGAHLAVPCDACHAPATAGGPPRFRIARTECAACHQRDDPHQGQFAGRACEGCHVTQSFTVTTFDHATSRYPLDGAHRSVPCASCHQIETPASGRPFRRFKPLGITCRDCHGGS